MRICVVGGGSTYTPELVDGLVRRHATLPVGELVLHDTDADRLAVLAGMAGRMLATADSGVALHATTDLDAAVDSAQAVLVQLRVGGQDARVSDEEFPLACGCVGQETTGAGGLAKALRTVPVVLDVAETVRRRAPDAWIVDFTNPVGIVTRALLDVGHRAVGLCNVAIGFRRWFAELLGVDSGAVRLGHVGLNHLTWERSVVVDGSDRLPGLLADHRDAIAARVELPPDLLTLLGSVPSYYLRYFYEHDRVVAEQRTAPSRAERVREIERDLLTTYADPTVSSPPPLLAERGGAHYSDAALDLATRLVGSGRDTPEVQVVDVRNDGTLPFLPDAAVVEVPCRVDPSGAHPLPVDPLPPDLAGLIAHVAAYEGLAVEAALRGGRDRVVTALLAHPLVGQYDLAERLADDLIARNADLLPWSRA
ncbi:MAG: 6-phospho-beta-glucosidase [Candidatus Nanopelagicales bacterium]